MINRNDARWQTSLKCDKCCKIDTEVEECKAEVKAEIVYRIYCVNCENYIILNNIIFNKNKQCN
jgi:hypothetical protein